LKLWQKWDSKEVERLGLILEEIELDIETLNSITN
jgi:hypothetical protein